MRFSGCFAELLQTGIKISFQFVAVFVLAKIAQLLRFEKQMKAFYVNLSKDDLFISICILQGNVSSDPTPTLNSFSRYTNP